MTRRSTRDMIVDVAAGLFGTVGLRRTTMETIAVAAGRGRRTVYMYFRNKAEIYDAVVENEIKKIIVPLDALVQSTEDPVTLIPRYGEERMRLLNELMRRNPLLLKDFAQGHSRIERLRDKLQKGEMQIFVTLLRKFLPSSGAWAKITPEDCATLYLGMLRGNDRLLTKTDGLNEAIRLSSVASWLLLNALSGQVPDS